MPLSESGTRASKVSEHSTSMLSFIAMSKHLLVLWLFCKFFKNYFDGKSVMSICSVVLLCYHYYRCMFVYKIESRGLAGRQGHGLKPSSSQ